MKTQIDSGLVVSLSLSLLLFSVVFSCFQLFSVVFSCFQLFSVVFSCFQLFSVVFSCFQLFSVVFSCFQLFSVVLGFCLPFGIPFSSACKTPITPGHPQVVTTRPSSHRVSSFEHRVLCVSRQVFTNILWMAKRRHSESDVVKLMP